jgi:hypothetical protein
MDLSLFGKHIKALASQKKNKESVITLIKEKSGILLEESEIQISKKEVIITVSSVKRSLLLQKGVKKILEENSFTLK